jgi:hypothetical protein
MKKSTILLLLLLSLVFSCATESKPTEASSTAEQLPPNNTTYHETVEQPKAYVETPTEKEPAEASGENIFDPDNISDEVFLAAKADITALIDELNGIIRARNYSVWLTHVAGSYLKEISSRAFLDEKTEELYRRDQIVAQNLGRDPELVAKRVLSTPRDYFNYVVVPSRANDRLDDISFLSSTRVRAYTVDERRGQRLVLYDLAHINDKWMIVN